MSYSLMSFYILPSLFVNSFSCIESGSPVSSRPPKNSFVKLNFVQFD